MNPQRRRIPRRPPGPATPEDLAEEPTTPDRGPVENGIILGLTALVAVPLAAIVCSPLIWLAVHSIRWAIS